MLEGVEEEIDVIKRDPKPRMFKQKNPFSREYFKDSVSASDKK